MENQPNVSIFEKNDPKEDENKEADYSVLNEEFLEQIEVQMDNTPQQESKFDSQLQEILNHSKFGVPTKEKTSICIVSFIPKFRKQILKE